MSPSFAPPIVQIDVDDDLNPPMSSNELLPQIDHDDGIFLSPNQDRNCAEPLLAASHIQYDLSSRKDAFKDKWTSTFSSDIPWPEFCSLCDEFAVETRTLAKEIAAVSSPTSNPRKPLPRSDQPSGRRSASPDRPLLSNSVEAQRIQTLYRYEKSRYENPRTKLSSLLRINWKC